MVQLQTRETPNDEGTRRGAILEAAQEIFVHYGFRRASFEQIASEAGISRTGLYHHFANKEEIFRAMAERLHRVTHEQASLAARSEAPFAERLFGVLSAKVGWFFDRLSETRHGHEIIDEGNRLCGDLNASAARKYQRLLAQLFRDADSAKTLSLRTAGLSADQAALYIVHCAWGLQGHPGVETPSPGQYRTRLEQLVKMTIVGLGGRG